MANDKLINDVAGLQATRLNNVIDPTPQYTDTSYTKDITRDFDPSCLAYINDEGKLCMDSVSVSSEIIFNYPFQELMEKSIETINLKFTVEAEGNPIFSAIGLGSPTVKNFQEYNIVINDVEDIDETINLLNFSKEEIANYMRNGLFRLYIVFLQGNEISNVKLSNITTTFTYSNNIINEVKVIENRLQALGFNKGDSSGGDIDLNNIDVEVDMIFYGLSSEDDDTIIINADIINKGA